MTKVTHVITVIEVSSNSLGIRTFIHKPKINGQWEENIPRTN